MKGICKEQSKKTLTTQRCQDLFSYLTTLFLIGHRLADILFQQQWSFLCKLHQQTKAFFLCPSYLEVVFTTCKTKAFVSRNSAKINRELLILKQKLCQNIKTNFSIPECFRLPRSITSVGLRNVFFKRCASRDKLALLEKLWNALHNTCL